MGAGIAKLIRKKYPTMFADYVERCRRGAFALGTAYLFREADETAVINIGTQGRGGAELWAIEAGFRALRKLCEREQIDHVAIPRIGSGLGGLDWAVIEPMLVEAFDGSDIVVDVFTLPDAQAGASKRKRVQ